MSKNILVISVDIKETRVALIEDGIIAELHIERRGHPSSGTVGNVVLGKVTRVLPGLQAAFIDVGQERAAFLHVEDLIRPDDFESYLAGGRKHAVDEHRPAAEEDDIDEDEPAVAASAPVRASHVNPVVPDAPSMSDLHAAAEEAVEAIEAGEPIDEIEAAVASGTIRGGEAIVGGEGEALAGDDTEDAEDDDVVEPHHATIPFDAALDAARDRTDNGGALDNGAAVENGVAGESAPASGSGVVALPLPSESTLPEVDSPESDRPSQMKTVSAAAAEEVLADITGRIGSIASDDDLIGDDLPGFTISDPGEPVPRAPVAPRAGDRGRGDRGRGRGRGRGREGGGGGGGGRGREGGRDARSGGGGGGGGDRGRGDRGRRDGSRGNGGVPNRISKSTPIREVVKEGQEIIVQISKDPIGTKGARCTSHISLPGRYVVFLPTVDHIGISKRIGSEKERARLRDAIEAMKPPTGGLIVRTVAEGLTKKQLKADVGYLVRLWGEIAKKREGARSPTLLASELDLVLKTARDLFTDDVEQIVIDDRTQYERLCRFIEMFAPERVKDIVYYSGAEPIFDAYGIEDEIGRALSRKVPLPSGGYLIIDQAEALTAIDVNTGRFVGKGSKDMEETILKTNLEAVNEIAYQLRFRNIGGLIILDLIDMEKHKNRELVRRTLEELLQKDKAKTTLNRISDLGLIEMTRKRTRESLGRLLHEPCFYCDGTGQLQSKETIAYEILREIRRKRADLPGYTVLVNAHPAVADLLTGPEKATVAEAENRYQRKITVVPRKDYHLEQFDLVGK